MWCGGGGGEEIFAPTLCTPGSDDPVLPVSGGGGAREKRNTTAASHICCFSRTTLFSVLWNQRYIYSSHCTCRRQKTNNKTPNVSQHLLILPQFEKKKRQPGLFSLKIVTITKNVIDICCFVFVFSHQLMQRKEQKFNIFERLPTRRVCFCLVSFNILTYPRQDKLLFLECKIRPRYIFY